MNDFNRQLGEQLAEIEHQGQRRHLVPVTHLDCGRIEIDDQRPDLRTQEMIGA